MTVNKALTIEGAQAGVDARSRAGAESVLSNTEGISVSASGVTFDGFTIQDSSVAAFTGFGIWLNPGVDGTRIVNNIIQNNIVGLGLSNLGTTQALVQHNLFQNNNLPGGASGTAIYTDQFVSGAVSNVLINENSFQNNANAGIALSSTDTANPDNNITITGNSIDSCGRGIYFFNTQSSGVSNNSITNLTTPTDGGSSTGIGFFGANSNVAVTGNNIETGAKYGVRVGEFITPNNTNLFIHENNIFGFLTAGLFVDNAPDAPLDYATCNWWGNATGPTNPILNPGGTGDVVTGDVVASNFNPWLVAPAPGGACGATPPSLAKSFSPSTIHAGHNSNLFIRLSNPNAVPATLTSPLVDNLPVGMVVVGGIVNTCGGSVSAPAGGSMITLTGGAIPPNSTCMVKLKVTVFEAGTYNNVLPANALVTNQGSNADEASAILTAINFENR